MVDNYDVFMAESQERLQELLNKVIEERKRMVVSKRESPHCDMKVDVYFIEQVINKLVF